VKNGTSCATPLADLCPVRNAYPLETLPSSAPRVRKGYPQSSALRCAPFVQTKGHSTPASRSAGSDKPHIGADGNNRSPRSCEENGKTRLGGLPN
jgi:hypothetical protein